MSQPKKTTVLAIDDELFAQRVLELALQRSGYAVVIAGSVAEGLKALEQRSIDVVTCDLMMPIESGLDFLRQVKDHPRWKEIPVIVVTAAGQKKELARAHELGAVASVSKPFSESQLKRVIESALVSGG